MSLSCRSNWRPHRKEQQLFTFFGTLFIMHLFYVDSSELKELKIKIYITSGHLKYQNNEKYLKRLEARGRARGKQKKNKKERNSSFK